MYSASEYTILIFIILTIIFSGIMISYNWQNNPPQYFFFPSLSYRSYQLDDIKPSSIKINDKKFLSDYTNQNNKTNNSIQLY
jgi:hypothetical protein